MNWRNSRLSSLIIIDFQEDSDKPPANCNDENNIGENKSPEVGNETLDNFEPDADKERNDSKNGSSHRTKERIENDALK